VNKTLWIVFAVIAGPPLALFLAYLGLSFVATGLDLNFLAIGECVEGSGCWDYVENVCRQYEPNAQALCDRGNPHRATSR
jgi:hypothetical protein